jgi:hypothetical protein
MAEAKKDLGKATAAKLSGAEDEVATEADHAPATVEITVEVRGKEITVTAPAAFEDADPDALLYIEQEKPMSAFRELIGEGQWRRMKGAGWTARHFQKFVEQWQAEVGLGNA